jgi:hypothetical protein
MGKKKAERREGDKGTKGIKKGRKGENYENTKYNFPLKHNGPLPLLFENILQH